MTAIDLELVDDIEAIKALIQAFFDSINAADPKALQSHFFPSAGLTILRQDPPRDPTTTTTTTSSSEKLTAVIRTTIERFVKLIEDGQKRRPPGEGPVLREAPDLGATDVKVDGLFATAWSPFTVTFDGVLHHYGTMVYTLGKDGGEGWRIEGLTQHYRRTVGWDLAEGVEERGLYE